MDGGACQALVSRVAKSWTRLNDLARMRALHPCLPDAGFSVTKCCSFIRMPPSRGAWPWDLSLLVSLSTSEQSSASGLRP